MRIAPSALLLLVLSVLPYSSPAVSSSLSQQQGALLSLKSAWKDPRNHLADWTPSSHLNCCSWTAVSCINSSVVGLSLNDFRLQGSLSAIIAYLPDLQNLTVSGNELTGTIPNDISELRNLRVLDLSNNAFQGHVPGTNLTNLKLLSVMNLGFNNLGGPIPEQLGFLANLHRLELRNNSFNGSVPQSLSAAVSLQYLMLENNNLSGEIPSGIGLLPHLKYLSFTNNSLSGPIPADFVNLRGVAAIYAGWNKLNGTIPEQFGNLSRLIHLQVQGNDLVGEIPDSFGSLRVLEELLLHDNHLSGRIPADLGALKNITILDLSNNKLSDSIPTDMGNMSSLRTLNLHGNNLSDSIPPALGNLSHLTSLNLSDNKLSGEVPMNGVLREFSASSFEGNSQLCGGPLVNQCESSAPPAPQGPPMSPSAGSEPPGRPVMPPLVARRRNNIKTTIALSVVGSAVGAAVLLAVVVLYLLPRRRKEKFQVHNGWSSPELSENIQKSRMQMYVPLFKFGYQEIVSHAGYYDTAHVLGKGRFATVYRSTLPDGMELAVKVFKHPIGQSSFEREMELLQTVTFKSILPIRGYYSNPVEKAIFYDLMPRGTLYDVLQSQHKDSGMRLPDWSQRYTIALGIAEALAHLHRASNMRFLHKDVKSTNVLLDADLNPFMTDFGLVGLVSGNSSVVETPGYAAPELRSSKEYSEKTDVYSFGVVLLELLTGKKPVSYVANKELNLASWVIPLHKAGRGSEVLEGQVVETCPSLDSAESALKLAILCLSEDPAMRPTMAEVVSVIEGISTNNYYSPALSPQCRAEQPLLP